MYGHNIILMSLGTRLLASAVSQEFQFGFVFLRPSCSLYRSITDLLSLDTNQFLPPLLCESYQLLETAVSSAVTEP